MIIIVRIHHFLKEIPIIYTFALKLNIDTMKKIILILTTSLLVSFVIIVSAQEAGEINHEMLRSSVRIKKY